MIITHSRERCNINTVHTAELQQELIARIRAGERQLIPQLWELLKPLTYHFVNRYASICADVCEPVDLLQDSYIALCEALDRYDPDKGAFPSVYYWALSTATRRTRGRSGSGYDPITDCASLDEPLDVDDQGGGTLVDLVADDGAEDINDAAERAVFAEQLHALFDSIDAEQLTREQRLAVTCVYWQGMSYAEAAEALAMSVDAVHRYTRAAIRAYRRPNTRRAICLFAYGSPHPPQNKPDYYHSSPEQCALWLEELERKTVITSPISSGTAAE